MEEIGIPQKELIRALQPLALGKPAQRVLLKSPKGRDFGNCVSVYKNSLMCNSNICNVLCTQNQLMFLW